MRFFLIYLFVLTLANPCFANSPAIDFMAQEAAKGINLETVGGRDPSDQYFQMSGRPGTTPEQMQQAQQDAKAFDWTIYPDPNPVVAGAAIQADTNIPIGVQVQLSTFTGLLSLYPYNPTGVQQEWTNIKATQSSWLTQKYIDAIEGDCLQGSIILNPSNNPNHLKIIAPKRKVK